MFIQGQNVLEKPDALQGVPFEQWLVVFKQTVIDHIAEADAAMAEQVRETLNNEAELSTKIIEACTIVLQTLVRETNEQAAQMLAFFAEGNNLDAKVSDLGLERQTISEGDPDAFPPVPPVFEDDDHLKTRFYLAPFSFSNAGPALAYKYHALTLDENPAITVESPEAGKVVVTYEFGDASTAAKVKDARAQRVTEITNNDGDRGKVLVSVLGRDGDGTPDADTLSAVESYFIDREDTAVMTDDISVAAADIVHYKFRAVGFVHSGPDTSAIQQVAENLLAKYADEQHRIKATVESSRLDQFLHQAGAIRIEKLEPLNSVVTTGQQAPFCDAIEIEIRTFENGSL